MAGEVTNEQLMKALEHLTRQVGDLRVVVLRQNKELKAIKTGRSADELHVQVREHPIAPQSKGHKS